jgi:hypothetical protein
MRGIGSLWLWLRLRLARALPVPKGSDGPDDSLTSLSNWLLKDIGLEKRDLLDPQGESVPYWRIRD